MFQGSEETFLLLLSPMLKCPKRMDGWEVQWGNQIMENPGCQDQHYFDFSEVNRRILKFLKYRIKGSRAVQNLRRNSNRISCLRECKV